MKEKKREYYYLAAKKARYRSRAAFKLIQLNRRFSFMFSGMKCVDLGSSPGGWLQVACEAAGREGRVVGVDISPTRPVGDAVIIRADATDPALPERILETLGGYADLVLSDMAPNISGNYTLDHARSCELVSVALHLAEAVLCPGGSMVAKIFDGEFTSEVMLTFRSKFQSVRLSKPQASRKQSSEVYIVAREFLLPQEME